jgi:hypothetical protein
MGSPRLAITLTKCLFAGSVALLFIGFLIGLFTPTCVHFTGPADRNLHFQIVDQSRGAPVAGARVALVHPYDPEQPPIEGMTDRQGRVELRGRFFQSGGGDTWHAERVTYFTYSPWCVTVRADGYRDFRRALGDQATTGDTRNQPLNLGDPAPSPIIIKMDQLASREH